MGIKGLLGATKESWGSEPPLKSAKGAVLIDFHAFVFWFLGTVAEQNSVGKFVSTDCMEFCNLVELFLALLDRQGLHPEFIADGKAGTLTKEGFAQKLATWKTRRANFERDDEEMCKTLCPAPWEFVFSPQRLFEPSRLGDKPFPKLLMILRRYLKLRGYFIYTCMGEADTIMDALFEAYSWADTLDFGPDKIAPPVRYVMTNDSDLLLMPNVEVIILQEWRKSPCISDIVKFVRECYQTGTCKSLSLSLDWARTRQFTCGVLSRTLKDLMDRFEMTHTQLVQAAILCGNDFCKNTRVATRFVSAVKIVHSGQALNLIRTHGLEDAYDYSLDFYRVSAPYRSRMQPNLDKAVKDYAMIRSAIYSVRYLRRNNTDPNLLRSMQKCARSIFSYEFVQRECAGLTAEEFLRKTRLIDMPSMPSAIIGENRVFQCDLIHDCFTSLPHTLNSEEYWQLCCTSPQDYYQCIDSGAVPPSSILLHEFNLCFRRRLYETILLTELKQDTQDTIAVEEWWTGCTVSVKPSKSQRRLNNTADFPGFHNVYRLGSDAVRLNHHLQSFVRSASTFETLQYPGPIAVAIGHYLHCYGSKNTMRTLRTKYPTDEATSYRQLEITNHDIPLLLMTCLMATENKSSTERSLTELCLDCQMGIDCWRANGRSSSDSSPNRNGEPSLDNRDALDPSVWSDDGKSTLSRGAKWLVYKDLRAFEIPATIYNEFRKAVYVEFPEFELEDGFLKTLCRIVRPSDEDELNYSKRTWTAEIVFVTNSLLACWSRIVDTYDHYLWSLALMLIGQNAPMLPTYFWNFECLCILDMIVNPVNIGTNCCSALKQRAMQLRMCIVNRLVCTPWFKRFFSNLQSESRCNIQSGEY